MRSHVVPLVRLNSWTSAFYPGEAEVREHDVLKGQLRGANLPDFGRHLDEGPPMPHRFHSCGLA